MNKFLVVIPTYNEAQSIGRLLLDLKSFDVDVLIVDDGSPDGTAEVARSHGALVVSRVKKLGLGSAYRAGFAWALARDYEFVIQMDADGSHQVSDLANLISVAHSADVIIGSRWVKGGAIKNWSKGREILSRSANAYSQFMLGFSIKDSTAGFRIYSKKILRTMEVETILSEGYCFQIEMTRRAINCGAKVREVPITFIERKFGQSKMSFSIAIEAIWRITIWGFSSLLGR